jgi:hypothetical protein
VRSEIANIAALNKDQGCNRPAPYVSHTPADDHIWAKLVNRLGWNSDILRDPIAITKWHTFSGDSYPLVIAVSISRIWESQPVSAGTDKEQYGKNRRNPVGHRYF